ncbi:response regulator [Kordiimonas lipolytica]|uniref:Response regulator n=1 Tax=Kordiimonas lipolytica TaxID=1662421 RepID=A0ABV8UCL3_9PROT|nr:response regulator [Kordiimonas lipolytica]
MALGNAQAAASLKDILLRRRVGVFTPANNRDAVEMMLDHSYNMLVIDEHFPDLGGIDFCRFLRLTNSPMAVAPVIFGIHEPNQKKVIAARDAGATKIAVMPFSGASLIKAMEDAANDPRPIIQDTSYNGPDRRTRSVPPPGGVDRRSKTPTSIDRATQMKILRGVKS